MYSIEFAVFVVPLRNKRWGLDGGRQARMWSVVVRAWWFECGVTLAVNLMWS